MEDLTFKEIVNTFEKGSMTELEVTYKDLHVICKKESKPSTIVQQETQTVTQPVSNIEKPVKEEVPASKNEKIITAPIVGTFYCAPTPDAKPYVNVGDCVKKGDTLCILEAMKMMNELEAEEDCTILEILAPQGELIEYGQPIFKVSL